MKTAVSQPQTLAKAGIFQMPSGEPFQGKGRVQATSIVLKNTTDSKRQHVAIGKLMQMCRESEVVTAVSRGITAEVRRDRDRGHD
jgi:hypothetical protein